MGLKRWGGKLQFPTDSCKFSTAKLVSERIKHFYFKSSYSMCRKMVWNLPIQFICLHEKITLQNAFEMQLSCAQSSQVFWILTRRKLSRHIKIDRGITGPLVPLPRQNWCCLHNPAQLIIVAFEFSASLWLHGFLCSIVVSKSSTSTLLMIELQGRKYLLDIKIQKMFCQEKVNISTTSQLACCDRISCMPNSPCLPHCHWGCR